MHVCTWEQEPRHRHLIDEGDNFQKIREKLKIKSFGGWKSKAENECQCRTQRYAHLALTRDLKLLYLALTMPTNWLFPFVRKCSYFFVNDQSIDV